jgi:glucose/arabinose dehydrogenase
MKRWSVLLGVILATALLPAAAPAATLVPLAPSSSWESMPIAAASPPGDPRVFVVERGGGVRIVEDGELKATPFLTVPNVDTNGERGLLSIAFAPGYATSGLFYVFVVAAGSDALDPAGMVGDLRVIEYRRSASNPDLADPASARLVLKYPHSATNHNGGQLAFGPDGFLYVTMGDGATPSNAQALANDLGKVLRIDPRDPPGAATFSVPPSNPFIATAGARPEIYALGLRNPFRASFAPDGDLILPDVGETTWEEVNVGRATATPAATTLAGANLGWPICEGACTPPNASLVDPLFQYGHSLVPAETTGCAIIGGYVVRDPSLSGLTGRYLYGDHCRQDLRTLDLDSAGADPRPAGVSIPPGGGELLGFGEDGRGCVYAMTDVTAYRVAESPTAGTACPEPRAGGPDGSSATATDSTAPRLSLTGARRQRLRRTLRVFATCDEACSLQASAALELSAAKGSASAQPIVTTGSGAAGVRARLQLKLPRAVFKRAKLAQSRGRKVAARVTVTATDLSGNSSRKTLRVRLSPPRPRSVKAQLSAMLPT